VAKTASALHYYGFVLVEGLKYDEENKQEKIKEKRIRYVTKEETCTALV
jgi:hypothetical protein